MRNIIVAETPSFAVKWYMTKEPLDDRWTKNKGQAASFRTPGLAQKFLSSIGHSGMGVKIVGDGNA